MDDSNSSFNRKKKFSKINPLEIIRDSSQSAGSTLNQEVIKPLSQEALSQIFGKKETHFSGELFPGESLAMSEIMSGKQEEREKNKKEQILLNTLEKEEKMLIEKRTRELQLEIRALHQELFKVAQQMPRLEQEIQIAAFQAPKNPGIFDLFFLRDLFIQIKKFRENIERASVWLSAANKRSAKKNIWGRNYQKHGAKYLLSGEHYLTRSAG